MLRGQLGPHIAETIRESTAEFLGAEKSGIAPERGEYAAAQVKELVETIANDHLGLTGEVHLFGSFSNGFRTGSSDIDVVFVGDLGNQTSASVLNAFVMHTESYGFTHVTKIFQANVPLIKMTHAESSIEVDLCINNRLGVRNSYLLLSYCCYESRLADLGRLVKAFAKSRDLVGTADGCLNSYAYMLLVVTYGLHVNLVPNLQLLAHEPVYIDRWDVKFLEDLSILPPSTCDLSLPELLVGFFQFYAFEFAWDKHAVCMRQYDGSSPVDKFSLMTSTSEDQWYIEDPFDLKHNLGGKCTVNGKKHILKAFREAALTLQNTGNWNDIMGKPNDTEYILRCRISPNVTVDDLFDFFGTSVKEVYFPNQFTGRFSQAFLIFPTSEQRRMAQSLNDAYIKECMIALHSSTKFGLEDALLQHPGHTKCENPWFEPPQPAMSTQDYFGDFANGQMYDPTGAYGAQFGPPPRFPGQGAMGASMGQQQMAAHMQQQMGQMGQMGQMPFPMAKSGMPMHPAAAAQLGMTPQQFMEQQMMMQMMMQGRAPQGMAGMRPGVPQMPGMGGAAGVPPPPPPQPPQPPPAQPNPWAQPTPAALAASPGIIPPPPPPAIYETKAKPDPKAEAKAKAAEAKAAAREEKQAQAKAKAEAKAKAQAAKLEAEAKAKALLEARTAAKKEEVPKAKPAVPVPLRPSEMPAPMPPMPRATPMASGDKRGVVIGASNAKASQILREAMHVPAPQPRSAYMPMKYRKIGPVTCQVDIGSVPSGEKIAGEDKYRNKYTIAPKWIINEKNIPKNSSSTMQTKVENYTGLRKVPVKDLFGMSGDDFSKLMRLL